MHRHEILEAFEHPNRASIFILRSYVTVQTMNSAFSFDLIVADARALTILMNELGIVQQCHCGAAQVGAYHASIRGISQAT